MWSDGLARYLVEKGSVALDGVSLTVSELREEGFSVSLIPETLLARTLGRHKSGIGSISRWTSSPST